MAKFDPFLSLDCAPTPSTLAQSKERKGSNFAIWQPCRQAVDDSGILYTGPVFGALNRIVASLNSGGSVLIPGGI